MIKFSKVKFGSLTSTSPCSIPHRMVSDAARCDICYKLLNKTKMARHKKTVHFKIKAYKCSVCVKSFGTSGNRATHEKCIHGIR